METGTLQKLALLRWRNAVLQSDVPSGSGAWTVAPGQGAVSAHARSGLPAVETVPRRWLRRALSRRLKI
eukprot:13379771-Alexandrium_andersonii.AAC.1